MVDIISYYLYLLFITSAAELELSAALNVSSSRRFGSLILEKSRLWRFSTADRRKESVNITVLICLH